jgi:lipopolysaccharide biosynthesis glycosyltransferase
MPEPIHVAIATDAGFAMQTATLLASMRTHGDDDYIVHVLHDGLDTDLRRRITSSRGDDDRVQVDWVDARSQQFAAVRADAGVSPAVFFRLRMAEVLPDLDRVVYLDADIIVLDSLRELWDMPLDDAQLVAAVRDVGFPSFAGIIPWRELDAPPDAPYFNSGMLVLSLDRWRASDVGGRALDLATRYTFRLRDQCALNVVCLDGWRRLPARWNVQRGHFRLDGPPWALEGVESMVGARDRPAVMHFCNPRWNRPWLAECDHPYRDEWFATLAQTPWAGWEPPKRPLKTRAVKQLKQIRRAVITDPDKSPWS